MGDVTSVAVCGSTGSIGVQTLEVIAAEPDRYSVFGLSANNSAEALLAQAQAVRPEVVAVTDVSAGAAIADRLPPGTELLLGPDAAAQLASEADVTINGVVGFAGLGVTLAALDAGRRLGLANKESLIAGGPVVQAARRTEGAELVPVDSEHCAIHQCLRSNDTPAGPGDARRVQRLVLTASGGPFRGRSSEELAAVTLEQALDHPTWSMGPKITVDSSTLMNKGLEVIEANELFGVPAGEHGVGIGFDEIDVVVHPQSIVHSMVEFTDGSTIAQLSAPDMRLPIGYALAWPDRLSTPFGGMDWATTGRLDFELPDRSNFGCLDLAYEAGRAGGSTPLWLNAANEEVVAAFLDRRIDWISIPAVCRASLDGHDGEIADSFESVIELDRRARDVTQGLLARHG